MTEIIKQETSLTKSVQTLFHQIIIKPTRLKTRTKTLTDNIFDSNTDENATAGNLTSPILDHLAQFLLYIKKSHRINKSKHI